MGCFIRLILPFLLFLLSDPTPPDITMGRFLRLIPRFSMFLPNNPPLLGTPRYVFPPLGIKKVLPSPYVPGVRPPEVRRSGLRPL